jgi:alpha-L-rhamnosidase
VIPPKVCQILALACLFATVALFAQTQSAKTAPVAAVDLRTDTRVNPLGLAPQHLRFSWRIENAAGQTAWQVQVADSEKALLGNQPGLWDSGWQQGGDTAHIAYAGKPLVSGQAAWWRLRVKDGNGAVSAWSAPAHFEMGLLADEEWQEAAWIGTTLPMDKKEMAPRDVMGDWIEGPQGAEVGSYKLRFDLPKRPVVSAMAYWSTSKRSATAIAFLAGRSDPAQVKRVTSGNRGYVDLSFDLSPGGANGLRVAFKSPVQDVAICFGMRVVFADGSEQVIRTGEGEWEAMPPEGKPLPVREVCRYGEKPLGEAVVFPRQQLAPVWMRTSVPVEPGLQRARLYVSSLGFGDATISGQPVSDAVLTPAQTDYRDHSQYDTHDVTSFLQPGDNALAVFLDPGWYDQVGGFGQIMSYGQPRIKAMLRLDYKDGTSRFVTSGFGWQFKESGLRSANLYLGERMDYRLEQDEWKQPKAGEGWQPVQVMKSPTNELIPRDLPPVRRLRELTPVKTWQIGAKTWLFDLGENITGWVRLKLDEPLGSTVRIRYSEMARNGNILCVPRSHWWCHGMIQQDEIICDGKPHVYESRFAFKGFRYVEVSGLSNEPKSGEIVAFEVGNDAPWIASFESSDPLLNRLFANGRRSHYGNMVDSLMDCPHREKCLWGGDLHVSWAFGFNAIDSATFYRHQVREGYTPPFARGSIPGNILAGRRSTQGVSSFNWSLSPLFIVWHLYMHNGDLEIAHEFYEPMLRFMKYFEKNSKDGVPNQTQLADHAAPYEIKREPPNNELISALNFFAAAQRFAQMARALGKPDDAVWADGLAATAHAAVMRFYRPAGHTFGNGTQDSLALAFGVIDDPAEEKQLAASLVGHYRKNGYQFDGGFMSYWIYPMLSRYGYGDDALKMMRNTQCVGPAMAIKRHDATTFYETYFSGLKPQFERSLNHHAGTHPAAWLLTDLAGIRFDNTHPGEGRLILNPAVPVAEDLDWVNASLMTRHGKVESSWKKDGNAVTWNFSVPPNTSATVKSRPEARLEWVTGSGAEPLSFDEGGTVVGTGTYRMRWSATSSL